MASNSDLPCDGDGRCMACKATPPEEQRITCKTCVTPWHLGCLSSGPETLADAAVWECPDCSSLVSSHAPPLIAGSGSAPSDTLVAAIRAIESDASLSDQEKAKKRQELLSGKGSEDGEKSGGEKKDVGGSGGGNDVLKLLSGSFNCSFCMQLPERPVTTPCGHNFCLKCFEKWVGQGKRTCAICRTGIPSKMASNPRINSSLVIAIRMAKMTKENTASGPPKAYHSVLNQNKPDKAYTTERAKKTGNANACSGKIFVTVPPDHFGPITAANDPVRELGVRVGETWEDRMECRQWGAHLPHVAGICGQSEYGAQSVALSGGYEDDEDHGEWFLYTGSGGRDLSGNKRTNKTQSFDQKFDKSNEALRVSCKKGYPVRVVRSHKEKRSAYAPENGVRYDGVYRIEKCWRKPGIQGPKVCRYLFVRCDNDPAPWTSDETGDRPRPLPSIKELKEATDITERKSPPSWDYDEEKASWLWKIPPPESKRKADTGEVGEGKSKRIVRRKTAKMSVSERLLKEFCCLICHKVMNLPLTTPCAHNFCKSCLQDTFTGQTFIKERNCEGRRSLRSKKNIMKCPSCTNDISEYLQNPQVNRELMSVIESLQRQTKDSTNEDVKETEVKELFPEAETEVKDLIFEAGETSDSANEDEEEEKDEKLETEVKDLIPEAGETSDSANEDVKESEKIEVGATPSPDFKSPRANKESKPDVTGNQVNAADNDIKAASPKPEMTESKDEKAVEVAKEGKKSKKQKKTVEDVKKSEKVEVVAKEGKKTKKQKNIIEDVKESEKIIEDVKESEKIVEDVKQSEKIEVVAKPSRNCKSPKANKKRKANVTDNDVSADVNDINAASTKPEVSESKYEKVVEVAKEGKQKKIVEDVKESEKIVEDVKESEKIVEAVEESEKVEAVAKPSSNSKSLKANKKRKADVTDNEVSAADNDVKAAVVKPEVSETKNEKVVEVTKEGKKNKKQKKNVDEKCSSPSGRGTRTRSRKA